MARIMNNKRFLAVTLLVLFSLSTIHSVKAGDPIWTPGAFNSGYSITTDYHGKEVQVYTPVTAYAGTTKNVPDQVKYVVIRWLRPDNTEAWKTLPLQLEDSGTTWTDGETIYWATDTRTPDVVDDWGVQAIYYNKDYAEIDSDPPHNDKVAIRATSFFAVPEVPLGTITATLVMMGTLILIAVKNKSNLKIFNRIL
jgi:hypothetical protein